MKRRTARPGQSRALSCRGPASARLLFRKLRLAGSGVVLVPVSWTRDPQQNTAKPRDGDLVQLLLEAAEVLQLGLQSSGGGSHPRAC